MERPSFCNKAEFSKTEKNFSKVERKFEKQKRWHVTMCCRFCFLW